MLGGLSGRGIRSGRDLTRSLGGQKGVVHKGGDTGVGDVGESLGEAAAVAAAVVRAIHELRLRLKKKRERKGR